MVERICRTFIKDYENHHQVKVRGRYGVLASIVGIALNVLMATFKITLGLLTHSMAVTADGFNNLSDVASNVATLLGFVFSVKNPDKEHPFGHGRLEYLTGLIIAVLIFFVGIQTLWESVMHLITPVEMHFSPIVIVVLVVSMMLKYLLGRFNFKIGEMIQSTALVAAGKDSKIDIVATFATLIAVVASRYTTLPLDGILGSFVSLLILKTGYEIAKETITSLLGTAPSEELLQNINVFTTSYPRILGTHDLMIHDYGPGKKYLTMHAEVNKNETLMDIHEVIDEIERDIYTKFQLKATIHLDPVDLDDSLTNKMRYLVGGMVHAFNGRYTMHDFRIRICGKNIKTVIFDVAIPANDVTPHKEIIQHLTDKIQEHDKSFNTLIEIDHHYV